MHNYIKLKTQALYASGNLGKSSIATLFDFFALFYFTDVLGFSALVAGNIILISMIWDGVSDPWIASIIDKLRNKFSTVKIYFLVGSPITALAAISFFNSHKIAQDHLLLYTIALLIIFRTAYTIVDIPHNCLLSFITHEQKERTTIASMRIFFSAVGRFFVTLASVHFLAPKEISYINEQFSQSSIFFSLLFLLVMLFCLSAVKKIRIVHEQEVLTKFSFIDVVKTMISNKALAIAFGLTAVTSLTSHALASGFLYFAKYGLGDESKGGFALTVMSISQASSLLLWAFIANHVANKRIAAQIANGLLVLSMSLAMIGIKSEWHLYGVALLAGTAIGGIYMLNWSILPDALDNQENVNKRRYDISVFGLYTLTNKICHGVSLAYVGWVLAAFNYTANSTEVKSDITTITSVILSFPLIGGLACMLLLQLLKNRTSC